MRIGAQIDADMTKTHSTTRRTLKHAGSPKSARPRSDEFDFFVNADLKRYHGQYVAIVGRRVAAAGTNAKDAWQKARKQYPRSVPTIAKLPKEEILVLLWR